MRAARNQTDLSLSSEMEIYYPKLVLVSGDGEDKLLGIPKLVVCKAEEEPPVYGLLVQWNLTQSSSNVLCYHIT